ncbi:FapA family protein [Thermodesulfatator indicus]
MSIHSDFPKEGLPVLNGDFLLYLSQDHQCVYLEAVVPKRDISPEEHQELVKLLKEKGVVYGLLHEPVWEGERLILARGKLPEHGEDASLEWLVEFEKETKEDEEQIDYREQKGIFCVRKGQEIAVKKPPTSGTPGVTVFGKEIPAKTGRDLTIKTNENVGFDPKSQTYFAKTSGVIKVFGQHLEIHPELYIHGDVDWDVGNIRFYGEKLIISGDVKRGFKVLVEGDLEILGNVEDETSIEVYGNLLIEGLVIGEKVKVFCAGQARIGAVEYSTLEIKKDLVVTDYLLGSKVKVGGDIFVTEGIGSIVGGEICARGNITAAILGSRANIETIIHAGYEEELDQKIKEVREKLAKIESNKAFLREALKKGINLLKLKKLTRKQIKELEKIKLSFENLLLLEESYREELKKLFEKVLLFEKQAEVKALEQVFGGVKVIIGKEVLKVTKNLKACKFRLKSGKIAVFKVDG